MTTYKPALLFKHTDKGQHQIWQISVSEVNGVPTIEIEYGKLNGKMIVNKKEITAGKNIGRSNETTPLEQAVLEAESLWNAQLDRNCYGFTPEESLMKRRQAPMLAEVFADCEKKIDWSNAYAQPKFNGHRCIAKKETDGRVSLISREGVRIESLHEIAEELAVVLRPGTVLDGELYIHGVSLQKISSLVKRRQDETPTVKYYVYDIVLELPFKDRWKTLMSSIDFINAQTLRQSQTLPVSDKSTLMEFQAKAIQKGYEGAMLRHGGAPYENGKRSQSLLKVKTFLDDEFEIVGVKEGEGLFRNMAVFTCDSKKGGTFDVTSPGNFEQKRHFWSEREKYIGKMLTVKYAEYTQTEDPKPFHPVALQIKEIL